MINNYVTSIAEKMGINLSKVSVVEGHNVGCFDVHLLNISCDNQIVSALVYQSELENLEKGDYCDRLEMKIRTTLSRLQLMLEV